MWKPLDSGQAPSARHDVDPGHSCPLLRPDDRQDQASERGSVQGAEAVHGNPWEDGEQGLLPRRMS